MNRYICIIFTYIVIFVSPVLAHDSIQHVQEVVLPTPKISFWSRAYDVIKEFSRVDTNYIEPQQYNYAVMIQNTNTYESYRLRDKDGNSISFRAVRDKTITGVVNGDGESHLEGYVIEEKMRIIKGDQLITTGVGLYPEGIFLPSADWILSPLICSAFRLSDCASVRGFSLLKHYSMSSSDNKAP